MYVGNPRFSLGLDRRALEHGQISLQITYGYALFGVMAYRILYASRTIKRGAMHIATPEGVFADSVMGTSSFGRKRNGRNWAKADVREQMVHYRPDSTALPDPGIAGVHRAIG
jgi:hypothetical protein